MTAVRADATSATSGTSAAPRRTTTSRIAAIGALALAAASTGLIVPALRLLVERTGHGEVAAGVFMASHVLGGAVGAALGAPALRLAGSPRALIVRALIASAAVTLAMAAIDSLAIRVALRFADGAFHLLAITALVAVATSGDPEARARRSVMMGLAIVLGIAAGLGLGALLAHPELALVVSAAMSCVSLLLVIAQPAADAAPPEDADPSARRPALDRTALLAPGLLAFGERFTFGTLSIAAPFVATPRQVGTVLGIFMTASAFALPLARRYALAWGPVRLAARSAIGFALALAVTAVVDVFGASMAISIAWALFGGASAGALYAAALVLVARSVRVEDRLSAMGTVHAGGSAGFALGSLVAGSFAFALHGMLVVAIPGIVIVLIATVAAWRLSR